MVATNDGNMLKVETSSIFTSTKGNHGNVMEVTSTIWNYRDFQHIFIYHESACQKAGSLPYFQRVL